MLANGFEMQLLPRVKFKWLLSNGTMHVSMIYSNTHSVNIINKVNLSIIVLK